MKEGYIPKEQRKKILLMCDDIRMPSGVGTVGVSTNASLTLDYTDSVPEKLYYNLEKSGYISTADSDVVNYMLI